MDLRKAILAVSVLVAVLAIAGLLVFVRGVGVGPGTAWAQTAAATAPKPQTKCPIMGGPINRKQFVDVDGYRIYVCCPGCLAKVKADPKAAVATIRANGEEPEVRGLNPVPAPGAEVKGR